MAILQKRIKEQRLKQNKTLLEVAEYVGVKEATLQRYESGEIKNIPHDKITAIAECLNSSPSYLMGWSNDIKDESTINSKLFSLINSLTEEQAKEALNYIDYLKSRDN